MPEQLDDFDRSLRDRIGAAEARVRVSSTAPSGGDAAPGPSRWLRPVLVLATAAVAVVLAVLVISQLPDRSVGDATPSPSAGEGVTASARNGDFVLTLSSPQSTWTTEDAIEITATLSYDGDEPAVTIGGACGPILFDLRQASGGSAAMGGAQCDPYIEYSLGPDAPLVRPLEKSGEVRQMPPFDRAFFEDPQLHLPPGRWIAMAIVSFDYPAGGDTDFRTLEVSIEIQVLEAEGSPGPSAVATEPPVSSSPPERSSSTPNPSVNADPGSVTGVLEGDPQLEGGCVWLRDQAGTAWEVIWPKGYEATFRDGTAAVVANAEVVATAGDRITVYGNRPSGVGSHCMVGTVYEAESVLIR